MSFKRFLPLPAMIPNAKAFNLRHQRLWLLPQKAVYWQKKNILILADLHVGKSGHFRKHGIPVPGKVNSSNIDLMDHLIRKINPDHLIILGDLFHSNANKEWESFQTWRKKYPGLEVSLVIGNHDILPNTAYHASHINLFKRLSIDPFLLIHDLNELGDSLSAYYVLSGHIHPAVQLKGKGRQSLKLPCFYFGQQQGILPAFGQFTGTHTIEPKQGDHIFTIAGSQILALSNSRQ